MVKFLIIIITYYVLNDATQDYLVNHFSIGLVVSAKEVNVCLY